MLSVSNIWIVLRAHTLLSLLSLICGAMQKLLNIVNTVSFRWVCIVYLSSISLLKEKETYVVENYRTKELVQPYQWYKQKRKGIVSLKLVGVNKTNGERRKKNEKKKNEKHNCLGRWKTIWKKMVKEKRTFKRHKIFRYYWRRKKIELTVLY